MRAGTGRRQQCVGGTPYVKLQSRVCVGGTPYVKLQSRVCHRPGTFAQLCSSRLVPPPVILLLQVVNFLEQQLATHGSAAGAAAPPTAVQPAASPLRAAVGALMHEALRPDSATPPSTDNVTAIVVQMDG